MSAKKENATVVGIGVAACAVCCAGPILGVLAASGLGTAAGFALIGSVAVLIGGAAIAFVLVRRECRSTTCEPAQAAVPVSIELGRTQSRS
jgi:hypothetical protein